MNRKGITAAALITIITTTAAFPAFVAGSTEADEKVDENTAVTDSNTSEGASALMGPVQITLTDPNGKPSIVPGCLGISGEKLNLYVDPFYDDGNSQEISVLFDDIYIGSHTFNTDSLITNLKQEELLSISSTDISDYEDGLQDIDSVTLGNSQFQISNLEDSEFKCIAVFMDGSQSEGNLEALDMTKVETISGTSVLCFEPQSDVSVRQCPAYVYLSDDNDSYLIGILLDDGDNNYYVYTRDEWGMDSDGWGEFIEQSASGENSTTESSTTTTSESETTSTTAEVTITETEHYVQWAEELEKWLPYIFGGIAAVELLIIVLLLILRKPKREVTESQNNIPEDRKLICVPFQHIGKRQEQQDSFGYLPIDDRGVLAVVADGMGGLKDGDKVSRFLVQTFMKESIQSLTTMPPQKALLSMLMKANAGINQVLGSDGRFRSGSTLLAVWAEKDGFYFVSVGDSHIYLIHDGKMYQVNREHIYETELHLKAVNREITFTDVEMTPKKGGLTSFVGMGQLKYVDETLRKIPFGGDDKILLMSDGVFNTLREEEILSIITDASDVKEASENLKETVLRKDNPKQDNFTCLIIAFQKSNE